MAGLTMMETPAARAAVTPPEARNIAKRIHHGVPGPRFLQHEGLGLHARDRQGKATTTPERTGVTKELAEDFADTAKKELVRLVELANGTPEERQRYEQYMQEDAYYPYRAMLETFSSVKDGTGTGNVQRLRLLDEEALDHHFRTKEGLMDAYEMRVAKVDEFSLNELVQIGRNLAQNFPSNIEDFDIRTAKGGFAREGLRALNVWGDKPINAHGIDTPFGPIRNYGDVVSTIALGVGVGAGIGGPIGALIGGAIPAGCVAVAYAFRNNERITFNMVRQAVDELNQIGQVRQNFARDMYNVDSRNRGARGPRAGTRRAIRRGTHPALPEMYNKTARDILSGESHQIERFQAMIGIPPELRGATEYWLSRERPTRPILRILSLGFAGGPDVRSRNFVPRGIRIEQEAQRQVLENLQYVRNGNVIRYLVNGQPNPDFNFNRILRDPIQVVQLRDRLRLARRKLWGEDFLRRKHLVTELKLDRKAALGKSITDQEAAHAEQGRITKERTAPVDRQLKNLGKDKEAVKKEIDELDAITAALRGVEAAQAEEAKARAKVTINFPGGAPPVGWPGGPYPPTDALVALSFVRDTNLAGFRVTVEYEGGTGPVSIESVSYRDTQEQNRHNTRLNTIEGIPNPATRLTGRAYDRAVDSETDRHTNNKNELNEHRRIIKVAQEAITAARDGVTTAREAVNDSANREQIQRRNRELMQARDVIESIHVTMATHPEIQAFIGLEITAGRLPLGFAIQLNTAALQTVGYEDLETRVNVAFRVSQGAQRAWDADAAFRLANGFPPPPNPRPPVLGWAAARNGEEPNRLRILHAMIEGRAARMPVIGAPPANFATTIRASGGVPQGWGIEEAEVLTYTLDQLRDRFRQRGNDIAALGMALPWGWVPGTVPTDAMLTRLQRDAQARFSIRQAERQERMRDIDTRIENYTRDRERIVREVAENAEIKLYKHIWARLDHISGPPLGDLLPAATFEGGIGAYIDSLNQADLERVFDPNPPGAATSRTFERTQPRSYLWLLDTIAGYRGTDVTYQNQSGELGAFNRARTYLPQNELGQMLNQFFNLQNPGGGPPTNFFETSVAMQEQIRTGRITAQRVMEFVVNRVIFQYIGQRVPTAGTP